MNIPYGDDVEMAEFESIKVSKSDWFEALPFGLVTVVQELWQIRYALHFDAMVLLSDDHFHRCFETSTVLMLRKLLYELWVCIRASQTN